ncbi:MAG: hypothetical protein PUI46_07315, partial [Lachnospiraceae bacterium]|nr:hypothetical protein [Lachnospiraceae bacterium]
KNLPFVDVILIYCYSGWRMNELAMMPLDSINLKERTFTGGLKNKYSRNRVVPIHSAIYELVCNRINPQFKSLIYHDGEKEVSETAFRESFSSALIYLFSFCILFSLLCCSKSISFLISASLQQLSALLCQIPIIVSPLQ